MSILEKYSLKEICDFQNGFAFKNEDYIEKNDDALEVFRMGYINKGGGYKDDSSPVFIPKSYPKNLEKYLLLEGDIAMAMTDMKNSMAILGYSARIPTSNRFVLNQRVGRIRVIKKDLVDEKYLYYFMNSKEYILSLQSKSNSGVQVNLGTNAIKDSIIFLPSLQRQKYVSDILYTLDEKIALNTQINQTLEQIAQTIFKSWFIDFDPVHAKANALASGQTLEQATQAAMAVISGKNTQELHRLQTANPEQYQQLWEIAEAFPSGVDEEGVPRGWEERELSYLFEFLSGAQPPKSEHIYEEKEGYERFIQNRDYSNDNHKTYIPISKKNKRCTEKDILMDKYGEAGKVRYGIKGAYNVALAKIVPQKDNLREFLRSYFTQDKIRNYLSSSSMASTRNSLNSTTFTRMKVIVPNDFLLSTFDKLANEKIDKILQIKQENIELSKLRDYLLPKLLSGEV
ncbi:restriction endonuclease subunit S [Glaesserella parasuis]|uniref:restriction endonuclease subunit S n=1 Tax=Glaesserella parasuis TaxID=738 RepID=UPI0013278CC0|nr:restriction endonuclease subunit S [Glaesserella parasuis]MWQ12259.1 restriction endonuclease subunit S [Glaesserella parasuis]